MIFNFCGEDRASSIKKFVIITLPDFDNNIDLEKTGEGTVLTVRIHEPVMVLENYSSLVRLLSFMDLSLH